MSRKSSTDQMVDDIGCLIFGALWLAVIGFFTVLFKSSQVSPEDQLLKLQPGYVWRWKIEAQDCPECGAVNESNIHHCNRCGVSLIPSIASNQSAASANTSDSADTFAVITIVVVAFLVFLFFAATS